MKRFAFLGLAVAFSGALSLGIVAVNAKPLTIELLPDTTQLKPGPNLDAVQGNCASCHSADYIVTQPRGEKFKQAFWEAEVAKMINVYGAPIEKADIAKIVEYLTASY